MQQFNKFDAREHFPVRYVSTTQEVPKQPPFSQEDLVKILYGLKEMGDAVKVFSDSISQAIAKLDTTIEAIRKANDDQYYEWGLDTPPGDNSTDGEGAD